MLLLQLCMVDIPSQVILVLADHKSVLKFLKVVEWLLIFLDEIKCFTFKCFALCTIQKSFVGVSTS